MEFIVTNEHPVSRLEEIVAYLTGPRLWIPRADYPDFDDWAERAYVELKAETKRAFVCLSGLAVSGVVLYQRHKTQREALEIKNVSVRPEARGRHVASFLLRNAELEGAREFGSRYVLCDAKRTNLGIAGFLECHRYAAQAPIDLYGLGAGADVVYRKELIAKPAPI